MNAVRAMVRVMLFTSVFTLEVRVRASEFQAYGSSVQVTSTDLPVQEPAGCLRSKGVCAIETGKHEKFEWKRGHATLILDRGSGVIGETADETRLVSGTVWVKAKGATTIRTEFGDVRVSDKAEFWVTRTAERATISAIEGIVILRPRGGGEDILVECGTENWLGRVMRSTGFAETGVPVAIPFRSHVERWARLFPGTRGEFEIELRRFHGLWSDATEKIAATHQQLFDRKIASIEDEKARKAAAQRKVEAENKQLREFFRQKVFDGY